MPAAESYIVRFEPDEEGWLVVSILELPACHTQAPTVEEGRTRIRGAIAAAIDLPSSYACELVEELVQGAD